ncbi:conserved hypothetical protein [Magnetococcus marinus MC-1]|uniref:DUF2065 domain-containing protein n=1 Tax=Magnetococcus marinus (strain ATCC BAA-1437 / JCM 17883 / MC-1) TaxID=156889 RepID=A0L7Z1_MAGMM|nr:DUF2065 domain-containing protein [Magnetococcus marinus]ABK44084.1 conserved hypothetical protein [Magnetococcus marinus MC-1]
MNDLLTALGLVFIIEGIPYFLAPGQMRSWVERMMALPDAMLRQTGLTLMIVGLLIIYLVRG